MRGQRIKMPKTTKKKYYIGLRSPMTKTPNNETIICHRCGYIVTKLEIENNMIEILKEENHRLTIGRDNWRKDIRKEAKQELFRFFEEQLTLRHTCGKVCGFETAENDFAYVMWGNIEEIFEAVRKKFNLK